MRSLSLMILRARWRHWQRRRERSSLPKLGTWLLLLFIMVFLWATGALGEALRQVAVQQLSHLLGAPVAIERVEIALFPPGISVSELQIQSGVDPELVVLDIKELEFSLAPSDLSQRIELGLVHLENVNAHVRLKGGTFLDFPALAKDEEAPSTEEKAPVVEEPSEVLDIVFSRVQLRNINGIVESVDEPWRLELKQLNSTAKLVSGFQPEDLELSLAQIQFTNAELDETVSDLLIRVDGEGDRYEIRKIGLQGDGAQVDLSGWLEIPPWLFGDERQIEAGEGELAFLQGYRGSLALGATLDLPTLNRVLPELPTELAGDVVLKGALSLEGESLDGWAQLDLNDILVTYHDLKYVLGSGTLQLKGTEKQVQVVEGVLEAGGGDLGISATMAFEEGLPIEAQLSLDQVELAELLAQVTLPGSWVMLGIDGEIHLEGGLEPFALAGDADLSCRDLKVYTDSYLKANELEAMLAIDRLSLKAPLRVTDSSVYLSQAQLASGNNQFYIDLEYGYDNQMDLQLDLISADLSTFSPVSGFELAGTGWGKAAIVGPVNDLMIVSDLDLFSARFSDYDLGDLQGYIVVPIRTYSFAKRVMQAVDDEADMSSLVAGYDVPEQSLVKMAEQVFAVNDTYLNSAYGSDREMTAMFMQDLDAHFRKSDYQGDVAVYFTDETILTAQANISDGQLEDILDMADVDLGEDEPVRGPILGELSVSGPIDRLDGKAEALQLTNLSVYGEVLERAELNIRLDQGDLHVDRAQINNGDGLIYAAGSLAKDGTIAVSITAQDMPVVDIEAVTLADLPMTGIIAAEMSLLGSLDAPLIQGRIDMAGAAYGDLDFGSLDLLLQTTDGTLIMTGALGERVSLDGEVHLSGSMPYTALVGVQDLPLDPFVQLNSAGQRMTSGVSFSLNAAGDLLAEGDASVRVSTRVDQLFLERARLRVQNYGPFDIQIVDNTIEVRGLELVGPHTNLSVSGQIDSMTNLDLTARGTLNLALVDFFLVDIFHRLEGKITGPGDSMVLHLHGTTDNPLLTGVVDIEDMAVRAVDFPQTIDQMSARFDLQANDVQINDLSGAMGGGMVTGEGELRLDVDLLPYYYNLSAHMEEVVLRYPEYIPPSEIRGDMTFQGDVGNLLLSGQMTVDRSVYRERINWEKDLLTFRPTNLGTVSVLGEGDALFDVSIRIVSPSTLFLRNNLGSIQMSADMMLLGDTNEMGVSGDVQLEEGEIYLLNNELEVVEGRVEFLDYRTFNPYMDITVQKEIQTYTISYRVVGTYEDYQITSSSDAGLSERDINSLLAFGVLADDLQGGNASAVAQPALEFVMGSFGLGEQVEGVVPIEFDRFGITPIVSDDGTPSVRFYGEKELQEDKLNSSFYFDAGGVSQDYQFMLEYKVSETFSIITDADQGRQVNARRVPNFGGRFRLRWEWE